MTRGEPRWWSFPLLAVVLLALLGSLAWLQLRWTDEVGRAAGARTRAELKAAGQAVSVDVDRALSSLVQALLPEPGRQPPAYDATALRARLDTWRSEAVWPSLVRDVYRLRVGPGEADTSAGGFEQLDRETAGWRSVVVPTSLSPLVARLDPETERRQPRRFQVLEDRVPAIVLPWSEPGWRQRRGRRGRPGSDRLSEVAGRLSRGVLIVELDRATLVESLLTSSIRDHFAAYLADGFTVTVRRREEPTTRVLRVPEGDGEAIDAGIGNDLFSLIPSPGRPPRGGRTDRTDRTDRADRADRTNTSRERPRDGLERFRGHPLYSLARLSGEPRWRLSVGHPAGSLEAVIARVRRRNLSLGLGVLGVLGIALAVLLVAMRRQQAYARQQLAFVAGVSHELLTPLAAMRSAGQNLADGVVDEPDRVRSYGAMIDREGRRLTTMVEQVLAFAGMIAGRPRTLGAVSIEAVVADALDGCAPLLEEASVTVDRALAPDLPPVRAEADALRRALQNLVTNAVKYGGEGGWIGIGAEEVVSRGRRMVALRVVDRGPGVPSDERRLVFEPFVRGRDAEARQLQGSGLGLSLVADTVRGAGGSVEIEDSPGGGATFVLRLQVAEEQR